MDSGYYAACAALVGRTQALDTIANNLANANTAGFRGQHNQFSSVLATATGSRGSSIDQALNDYGIMGGTSMDYGQGTLQKTGNDLDVAVQGSGFFVVQTANGPVYTRNGGFQVSSTRQLITATGDAVMGASGPISVPPGAVSISTDGTISTNGAVSGKLQVVQFAPGVQLTSIGNTYYTAPPDSAKPDSDSTIEQGMLEGSNVNPVAGMVELIQAQRSAEMMQKALSMFNSEMDKTATQDLPKNG